jgi:hypothetical protein
LVSELRALYQPSIEVPPGDETSHSEPSSSSSQASDQTTASAGVKDVTHLNVTVPKKWMLRSGLPDHPLVVIIFDPQTEKQSGYGLSATAAGEMAVGLVKYADTVAKHQAKKQKPN